jgi:hypothetical protein
MSKISNSLECNVVRVIFGFISFVPLYVDLTKNKKDSKFTDLTKISKEAKEVI